MDQKRISYCVSKHNKSLKESKKYNKYFRDNLIDKILPSNTNIFFIGDSVLDNFIWLKNPKQNLIWQMNQKIIGPNTTNYMFAVNETETKDILNGKKPSSFHQTGRKKYNLEKYPTNTKGKVFPLKLVKNNINPDRKNYVVLSVGGNDCRVCLSSLPKGWEAVWKEMNNSDHNYTNNYKKIIDKLSKMDLTGIILVSVYLPYIDFVKKNYKEIEKVIEKSKKLLFKIAQEFNLPVIDLSKSFDNKNPTHYGREKGNSPIEPSNISSMFISNLVTYVINDFDFEGNVSKIYYGQNLKNIKSVNNIEIKEQIKSTTKPERILSDLPIEIRKIMYEYAKTSYVFRNIGYSYNNSDCCYSREQAYDILLENEIKEGYTKNLKDYVKYADYYNVYLLDLDNENIYTDTSYSTYKLYADEDYEDDFEEVKLDILDGKCLVEIGQYGFKIMAILPNNETLKNNNKKLIKLKNHIMKNFNFEIM